MQIVISYSSDRNKPRDQWTEETYTDREQAEAVAIDLLYCGFYLRIEEHEEEV